jgi:hypothetical protein
MHYKRWHLLFLGLLTFGWAEPAAAQVALQYRGHIGTEARFSLPGGLEKPHTGSHPRFLRNETEGRLRFELRAGRHVQGIADTTLIFTGKRDVSHMADLSIPERVDPFRVRSDALFVRFRDLGLEGLDLTLGRMIVPWGTADMFNPTRRLNSLDLENALRFGASVANQMVVLDWAPGWTVFGETRTIFDELTFQVAVVPVFRGAMLPESGLAAFSNPQLARGRFHSSVMADLFDLQTAFEAQGGALSYDVRVQQPDVHLRNVQVGARMGFNLLGVDLSFSYYRGFDGIPQPETVYAEDVVLPGLGPLGSSDLLEIVRGMCPPDEPCMQESLVHNRMRLSYPRIQVVGADMATSLEFLGGAGLWAEVAVVVHDDLRLQVRTSDAIVDLGGGPVLLPVASTRQAVEIEGGAFVKATVGMDYTIFPWWYVNAQYLHGFVDEFGGAHLNDYLVVGSDFKFLSDRVLLRLFTIFCIQDQSTVLYPQLSVQPWGGMDLTVGGLIYLGANDTVFGSPLTGPSFVFVRGQMNF